LAFRYFSCNNNEAVIHRSYYHCSVIIFLFRVLRTAIFDYKIVYYLQTDGKKDANG